MGYDGIKNKGIVVNIANNLYSTHTTVRMLGDLEDVIQIGMIGLLKAQKAFKPEKGLKFAYYAAIRIRGEILDEALNAQFIRTPKSAIRRGDKYNIVQKLSEIQDKRNRTNKINSDEHESYDPPDKEQEVCKYEYELARFIRSLRTKEKIIVIRYFGLYGEQPETLKVISRSIGLSESRCSQMLTGVLERARQVKYFDNYIRKISTIEIPKPSKKKYQRRNIRSFVSVA